MLRCGAVSMRRRRAAQTVSPATRPPASTTPTRRRRLRPSPARSSPTTPQPCPPSRCRRHPTRLWSPPRRRHSTASRRPAPTAAGSWRWRWTCARRTTAARTAAASGWWSTWAGSASRRSDELWIGFRRRCSAIPSNDWGSGTRGAASSSSTGTDSLSKYACAFVQGGRKKVSHYQESSLNRIKNRQYSYISHQFSVLFEYKNVISLCQIFHVWPNLWRHQLLCLKLRHA